MLGLEFVCAAAVSAESSFYHMSGPISGQNSDEKLGGNCLGGDGGGVGGRAGDKCRRNLGQQSEGSGRKRVGQESGSSGPL